MKSLETEKPKANKRHDAEEAERLARIEEFERYQFEPWLQTMSVASGLTKERVIRLLYHAGEHGLVVERRVKGSNVQYLADIRFVGWLPMEIATEIFIADQWHRGKSIPDRWIYWNEKRTELRAQVFNWTDRIAEYVAGAYAE